MQYFEMNEQKGVSEHYHPNLDGCISMALPMLETEVVFQQNNTHYFSVYELYTQLRIKVLSLLFRQPAINP